MKAEILYGFHPVYEALRAGRRTFHEIYISKQPHARRIERIRAAADRKNILLKEASPAKLQAIGGPVSHQGVMARVTAYPLADTADLLGTVLSGTRPPFFLLLDQIVDPHNLGAIIRTGLCAGIDGVIIRKGSVSATFLPQVWEQLPRPEAFLSNLCAKAGLPADQWKQGGLTVLTYQVQYFEEAYPG